jgi:putative ABC transport system permease protein
MREVALGRSAARRLAAGIGDQVTVTWDRFTMDAADQDPAATRPEGLPDWIDYRQGFFTLNCTADLQVTGLFDDSLPSLVTAVPAVLISPVLATEIRRWDAEIEGYEALPTYGIMIALADGADPARARDAIVRAVAPIAEEYGAVEVTTPWEQAGGTMDSFLGTTALGLVALFVFSAIALAVAGLVIANTFQVLIAQRAHTLGLLRCVGATRRQIRRSVILEGAATGLAGGLAGIVVGAVAVQIALVACNRLFPAVPVPAVVSLPWAAVALPLLTGVLVSTMAARSPATRATKTPPIAALRPLDRPTTRRPAGRARAILAAIGAIGGAIALAAALAVAVFYGRDIDTGQTSGAFTYGALLVGGIFAAVCLVVSVIIAGPFWIPRVVRRFAGLLARTGPGARVAAANTVRNPRRTAATAGALVIGVTLVATVSTGSATAERSLEAVFAGNLGADFRIGTSPAYFWDLQAKDLTSEEILDAWEPLPSGLVQALSSVEGVGATAEFFAAPVDLTSDDPAPGEVEREKVVLTAGADASVVFGVDPDAFARVHPDREAVAALRRGEVLVPTYFFASGSAAPDWSATITGPLGSRDLPAHETPAQTSPASGGWVVSLEVLNAIVPATVMNYVEAAVAPGADAGDVADRVSAATADYADSLGNPVQVYGAAIERATSSQVIEVILIVLMALLAVAVMIALVGVANTLALSVVERTREHGLLRALGLTRGQMWWMLALEGMSVSGIGAAIGIVLGTGLGWAGTYLALSVVGTPTLGWYPGQLAAVFGGSILAGLVASALPGRRAARTSPAAALATE